MNGKGTDMAIDFGGIAPAAAYANLLSGLNLGQVSRPLNSVNASEDAMISLVNDDMGIPQAHGTVEL